MNRLRRFVTAAVVTLCITPAAARAQLGFGVACTPGIPGCASLRFSFTNPGTHLDLNTLTLSLAGTAWTFTAAGSPRVGFYSAMDSYGPFAGFATMNGVSAMIDFTDNGFPFSLFAGASGYLDIEATGTGDTPPVSYTGTTVDGETIMGNSSAQPSVVPEPATVMLLAAGLGVLAVGARRRARIG